MSELDFFKELHNDSIKAYGNPAEVDSFIPVPPMSQTWDAVIQDYKKTYGTSTVEVPSPQVKLEVYSQETPKANVVEESPSFPPSPAPDSPETLTQKLTHMYPPVGSVPPSYGPSKACGNCTYFCCDNTCSAFNFPVHCLYTCSSHSQIEDCCVESYSDNRTSAGNVTAKARDEKATLSNGRYPIFDKKSAISALKLRGHTSNKQERSKVIAAAAKYAPEEAAKAREEDKQKLSVPTEPKLWQLAQRTASNPNDPSAVKNNYVSLFAELFGKKKEMFASVEEGVTRAESKVEPVETVEIQDLSDPADEAPTEEKLSVEFAAAISAPAYTGDEHMASVDPKTSTLYAIAESRIKSKYRQQGRDPREFLSDSDYLGEVQREYNRLVIARSK